MQMRKDQASEIKAGQWVLIARSPDEAGRRYSLDRSWVQIVDPTVISIEVPKRGGYGYRNANTLEIKTPKGYVGVGLYSKIAKPREDRSRRTHRNIDDGEKTVLVELSKIHLDHGVHDTKADLDAAMDRIERETRERVQAADALAHDGSPLTIHVPAVHPSNDWHSMDMLHSQTKETVHLEWDSPGNHMARLFLSLAMWMQTTFDPEDDAVPARSSVRRYQRARDGSKPGKVRYLKLRRLERQEDDGEGAGGTGGKLTHQFIVGPFWRNQPHGPGNKLRRLQLIPPFIKGPEGTELIYKDRVIKVDR